MQHSVLSTEDLTCFEQQGYIRVPEAFPQSLALGMQDFMWLQLKALHGVERTDCSTWSHYEGGLNKTAEAPIYVDIAAPRMCAAIDQLLGARLWAVPRSWGGFLVTFPQRTSGSWALTTKNWHWDGKPSQHLPSLNALFILTLFSQIEPCGGGTLLVSGSHRLIRHFFESGRRHQTPVSLNEFRLSYPWIAELSGITSKIKDHQERIQYFMQEETEVEHIALKVVEVSGAPGDAYLCHPAIFHAASPNHADVPRFMRAKRIHKIRA